MLHRLGLTAGWLLLLALTGCSDSGACEGPSCGEAMGGSSAGNPSGGSGGAAGSNPVTAGRGGGGGNGGAGGSTATAGSPALGGASSNGGSSSSGGSVGDLTAPPGSAVFTNGKLSVVGKELRNQSGNVVQLKGVSSMWLNWEDDGYAESRQALEWLRDNWKVQVIRAAMGIDPADAYLEDPETAKAQIDRIVQNAVALGLYVILDWHDHTALDHQAAAEAFFDEMAGKYAQLPNVLYEPFNEPLELDWDSELKPYHQALVAKIRAKDPDNVIVLGTPNWSQDVDIAADSPVTGTNLLYTLHFYACSHQGDLIDKARAARSKNLPLFVTEWGATNADGGLDGEVCTAEAQTWLDFLDAEHISWTSWKLDDCSDASCLFKDGAPEDGGFGDEWLQGHGPFVRDHLKQ